MKLGTLLSMAAMAVMGMGLALPAQAADPIKIGVYLPLTGQNAFGGQLELEGIQLAHKRPSSTAPSNWSSSTTSPTRSKPPTP